MRLATNAEPVLAEWGHGHQAAAVLRPAVAVEPASWWTHTSSEGRPPLSDTDVNVSVTVYSLILSVNKYTLTTF